MSASRVFGVACLTALLVVAGCGSSSSDGDASPPDSPGDSEAVSSETPVVDEPDAAEAATPTPAPPASPQELADIEGFTTITVTTPATANGEHPLLSWEPLDSAAEYVLALTLSDGEAYWAWRGTAAEVFLGGSAEPPPADSSGPYLFEPMTLRVVAVDADGVIFAASQPVQIAP